MTSAADREFHEDIAIKGITDPEGALAELDAKYHDHLPEGTNCYLCGIEHAAINPSNFNNDYLYEDQS